MLFLNRDHLVFEKRWIRYFKQQFISFKNLWLHFYLVEKVAIICNGNFFEPPSIQNGLINKAINQPSRLWKEPKITT